MEIVFSVQSFRLQVEILTEISGSQFLKIYNILTNVNDFLASGTIFFHFFKQKSTVASGLVYSSTVTYFLANTSFQRVFCLLETVLFYSKFFSAIGHYY